MVSDGRRSGSWAGYAAFTWTAMFMAFHVYWYASGSLGYARLEDTLDRAERLLTATVESPTGWSMYVRLLRKILARSVRRRSATNAIRQSRANA